MQLYFTDYSIRYIGMVSKLLYAELFFCSQALITPL